MEENQREESGISLKDIFRTIFSQKWIALIIFAVITVAGTAGIYYGSAKDRSYNVSFVLTLPGSDEYSVNYQYPDGTAFRYSEMVSLSKLKSVKEASEEFSGIDIEAMAQNGDISISREISETKTGSGSAYESTYTISIKAGYFKSFDLARKFMQALAYTPGYYLSQLKINYSYIELAEEAPDYVSTVTVLKQQLEDLLEQYEALIKDYGASFVVENGKTLQSYMRGVSTYVETDSALDNLITRANLGGYLKNGACVPSFETQLKQAENDLADAKKTLDNMLSDNIPDQPSSYEVVQLQSDKVNELSRKVEYLNNYLKNAAFEDGTDTASQGYSDYVAAKTAYETELKAGIDAVKKFTDELQSVTSTIYNKSEAVSFTTANIISAAGGKSIVWSFGVSFIAGLVLALVIAYAVGAVKADKAKQRAERPESAHAECAEKDEK